MFCDIVKELDLSPFCASISGRLGNIYSNVPQLDGMLTVSTSFPAGRENLPILGKGDAVDVTEFRIDGEQLLACLHVPESDLAIKASAGDRRTVGTEDHGSNALKMSVP